MKLNFTPITAAALIPATLVGIALSVLPFTQAVPAQPAAHGRAHAAALTAARPDARGRSRHSGHAGAIQSGAKKPATASQPATASTSAAPSQQAPASQQPTASEAATSSQPLTAGMSAFEQCVAWRESGDNPTASSAGLFGILPSVWAQLGYPGTAGQASVTLQKVAFDRLYAQYGVQPWAPSDGC